jgi:hypothetical protein
MAILGISAGKSADGELEVGFRRGWLRSIKFVLSSAGGAAAAIAVVELLDKQPREGFALLTQWGPWPFIALVALAIVAGFMSQMSGTIQTTFAAVVASSQLGAEAQTRTADALTRLAEQGGRQAEEVRRLAIYAAQEFPSLYLRLDKQDTAMEEVATLVKSLVIMQRGPGDK